MTQYIKVMITVDKDALDYKGYLFRRDNQSV